MDPLLQKARSAISNQRVGLGQHSSVGAMIGPDEFNNDVMSVLSVGEDVAAAGIGPNMNNVGALNAKQYGAKAIYVSDRHHPVVVARDHMSSRYQDMSDKFKIPIIVESHYRHNNSTAYIFRPGSSAPEVYANGMKY